MAALVVSKFGRIGRKQVTPILGVVGICKRHKSHTLTNYKRGTGGRSSFSGTVATVFGASGYLGGDIVNRLGKTGSQVIVPYRADPYEVQRLRLCGDLGQILFYPIHLQDEAAIKRCMKYSNVVINLIGREWETKNFKFDDVHVDGARLIAKCAREAGVEKLLHMSALNASENPQKIYLKKGSQFLASKARGEDAVREEFPDAIVFRPSDIFGGYDKFVTYYAKWWRRSGNRIPMWRKGMETIKQPVFRGDVATGIVNAIQDPDAVGKTFDIVGPHRYYLGDLVQFFYRCLRNDYAKISFMDPIFRAKVRWMTYAPATPIMTWEKIEREFITDMTMENPTLEDLGVKLTRIEDRAIFDLKPMRLYNYYEEKLGEFAPPSWPPVLA
ncbi:NADH dehydrogenase [ubiquinone] 1 alpha subcomplex subunit 9, mitochondrial-like [Lineus longissimus]|uniref:NADH dehydrogenase [ubiquinone] 1 alpha subcomplex subunit 9, mitochondrial-like n=1 Tax=Lineus longissimus TaxID=88925 RepID=UPI002B4CAAED